MHWLLRLLALGMLSLLLLAVFAPHVTPDRTLLPLPGASGETGRALLVVLHALSPAAACTPTSDPQTCADAFLQPFDRPFQIAILVLLGIIGGFALLGGLVSLARGSMGGMFGEPRWVSKAMIGVGTSIFALVVAIILVNVFGNVHGLVPQPTLPHLGGGN